MRSVSRTNRLMMEPSDVSTVESSEPSTSCSLPTMVAATGIPGPTTSGTRSATAASKSWKQYLSRKHLGRHLTKSTAVYCVLVVGVWIFHGIPIVVFYSSAPQVGRHCTDTHLNISMCKRECILFINEYLNMLPVILLCIHLNSHFYSTQS